MISYAQNFEDVILARCFSDRKIGFYIDVGAGDPVEDSVTKYFYDLGWSGINVEPHREKFRHLAGARPRDVNLELAVSASSGAAIFYERENWGLSSLNSASDSVAAALSTITQTYQVRTETLTQICAQHVGSHTIDFLKIDAEGAERDVIASMSFEKYPATIVIVEATRPNTQVCDYDKWEGMLLSAGYSFAYFDGLNRFYLHQNAEHLRRHFALPPNVFDTFTRQTEVFYHEKYEQVVSAAELRKEQSAKHLEREQAEYAKLYQVLRQQKVAKALLTQTLEQERVAASTLAQHLERERQEKAALVQSVDQERVEKHRLAGFMEQQQTIIEQTEARNRELAETIAQLDGTIIRERVTGRETEVLCAWNIAQRQRWLTEVERRNSFTGCAKHYLRRLFHQITGLYPRYRQSLNILLRALGPDGTEAIYGQPYDAIGALALRKIARSAFWRDAVIPLQDNLCGLFDRNFYLDRNPDLRDRDIVPLRHYILFGAAEGRNPHPLFDGAWYLSHYPDVKSGGHNPLYHFANSGGAEGRDPNPLFDSKWYLAQNTDVANAGINPLVHYIKHGAAEGRNPNPLFDSSWYLAHSADGADTANSLVHYLIYGAPQGRDPTPLFDTKWYLARYPDVWASGVNPLGHYLARGSAEGYDPNPLFDSDWYLSRYSDVAAAGVNPLAHYITWGAAEGRDPNPLFDAKWYLTQNCETVPSGTNPLVHYLTWGAAHGRDPNPLFDSDWYLARNADVADAGVNPLVHYITRGAAEGRDPNPLFDSDWYRAHNIDVADSGANPLAHYIAKGAAERRDPNPFFDTEWYLTQYPAVASGVTTPLGHYLAHGVDAKYDPNPCFNTAWYLSQNPEAITSGLTPLAHYLTSGGAKNHTPTSPPEHDSFQADAQPKYQIRDFYSPRQLFQNTSKPLIICITHVFPWPPRSGNEYRIARILDWLSDNAHELLVVVVPMVAAEPSEKQRNDIFSKYNNVAICYRDGRVLTSIKSLELSFNEIDGRSVVANFNAIKQSGRQNSESVHDMELRWCHESLIGLLVEINKQIVDTIYYINYAFMTRFLEFLPRPALSFVDTHDIFSHRATKVGSFGIPDASGIPEVEERRMLQRANALVAIHSDDARALNALVPGKLVIHASVDFSFTNVGDSPPQPNILFVAYNNPMNVKGARDFLRFAWPKIKHDVPGAELVIVGQVGEAIRSNDPQVRIAGIVDSLEPYYRTARVVVNPAVAGTGLKIKTVESVAYFRPIVTWPHGVDGIGPPLLQLCNVAHNWYEFAEKTIALLSEEGETGLSTSDRDSIKHQLQADVVYRDLGTWLNHASLSSN